MTTTIQIGLRVSTQTKADIQQYADEHGVSINAALNVLIRKGLQAELRDNPARRLLDSAMEES